MTTTMERWPHLSHPHVIRERAKQLSREFGDMRAELVRRRRDAGMTQKDVADILGVSQQRVSHIERYDSDLRIETVQAYANAVGVLVSIQVEVDESRPADNSSDAAWTAVPLTATSGVKARSGVRSESRTAWSSHVEFAANSKRTEFHLVA